MQSTTTPLELFFQTWELNMASGNVPALVASFAEVFLYAGPHGTQSVKASDFALALPKRKQLFKSLGSQPTTLVSLNETQLDRRYTMACAQWLMTFIRNGAESQQVLGRLHLHRGYCWRRLQNCLLSRPSGHHGRPQRARNPAGLIHFVVPSSFFGSSRSSDRSRRPCSLRPSNLPSERLGPENRESTLR